MKPPLAPASPNQAALLPGPAALRELARAFAHVADFQRFTSGLEQALGRAEFFADARVQLLATKGDQLEFGANRLTLPLAGGEKLHGALHVAGVTPAARPFGAEDLHLLSALATVIAAALDHATRHGELRRNLDILSLLLDLAPVGLVAVHADGRIVLANELARRWLGVERAETIEAKLGPDWRSEGSFHLRAEGKLIYGEARHGAGATALVLVDLTSQQALLIDGLQRELYRCRWLGLKLTFVLLGSRPLADGLLARLPELRAQLQPGEFAGPYDAHRVGLVLPGLDHGAALVRLRALTTRSPFVHLTTAVVPADGAKTAGEVLDAALAQMRPAAAVLRPALLLHDDYPAVNDMLALMLRDQFELVKSHRYADTVAQLRTRPFDAIVTEVDLREGSGIELARLARQLQPGIRPIFTTVAHQLPPSATDPLLAGHLVLLKPFDIARVESDVRTAIQSA